MTSGDAPETTPGGGRTYWGTPPPPPPPPNYRPAEGFWSERGLRIFLTPTRLDEAIEQIDDLRVMLLRVIQEVEALRALLEAKGAFSPEEHGETLVRQMLRDHGGPGPYPWTYASYYPYTLEEVELLRRLGLSDEAIRGYRDAARERQTPT